MTRAAIVFGCVLSAASNANGQAIIGGDWRADVAAFAQRAVDTGLTPGISVAVAVQDWVVFADGFGVADAGSGRKVTGDTPFYIASSTKSLTATAAAIAAHHGRLEFGRPMVRYLPGAKLPAGMPRERVTVHDLAALTHGLNGNGPIVFRTAFTGDFTSEQLLELLQYHSVADNYGSFNYNNLGFNLLGMVLERVYDETWKDVVQRLVATPIGMSSTTAYVSQLPPDRAALPHEVTPQGWRATQIGKQDANMHAAGGHFSSARDLARYLAVHMTNGILEGTRVLPAEPLELTHMVRVQQNRRFGRYQRHAWGYGWDIGTSGSDTLIHRFGSFGGYRSHMSFMPQHDIGVAVLVNGDGPASDAADLVADYVYDRLLSRSDALLGHQARLDTLAQGAAGARATELPKHLAERRARLQPLPHPLDHYAGVFNSPQLGTMEWRMVAGGLEMKMGVIQTRAEVFNAAANRLRIEVAGSGQVVEFLFPEDGGPARAVKIAGEEFVRVSAAR